MPGPNPAPASLKLVRGNPGKRAIHPEREPALPASSSASNSNLPFCPEPVSRNPSAKRYWDQHVGLLSAMKVLTAADQELLADFCLTSAEIEYLQGMVWAGWERQADSLGASGLVVDTTTVEGRALARILRQEAQAQAQEDGQALTKLLAARKLKLHYERELGLTPAARTRVQVASEEGNQNDPWAAFDRDLAVSETNVLTGTGTGNRGSNE